MLEAWKSAWEEMSDNFYENWQTIVFHLYTLQYVMATGDLTVWEQDV